MRVVMSDETKTIASIDIGSNSIQITIADVCKSSVTIRHKEKTNARLGASIDAAGRLDERIFKESVRTILAYTKLAREHGADVRAVGTAALRKASNQAELVSHLRQACELDLHVISGSREAHLIRRGVMRGMHHLTQTDTVLVDVGGGSTEISLGQGHDIKAVTSIPLGGLSAQHQYFRRSSTSSFSYCCTVRRLSKRFAGIAGLCRDLGFSVVVATGGTAQRIARILAHRDQSSQNEIDGAEFTHGDLAWLVSQLRIHERQKTLESIPGMDPSRADIMLGGAAIYTAIGQSLGTNVWLVSKSAMRTGVLTEPSWPRL